MAKTIILCDSKRSSFIIFFKIQFDTAALIIHSFRMIKARGCKQRFESDLLYLVTWYLGGLGLICEYYFTVS